MSGEVKEHTKVCAGQKHNTSVINQHLHCKIHIKFCLNKSELSYNTIIIRLGC